MTLSTLEAWACEAHPTLEWPHGDCAGPGMPMKVETHVSLWDTITSRLGPDDLAALNIDREQAPLEWIARLAAAMAEARDTEPCDRDHCPTNCSPNCHLTPTGAPNAKA